MQADPQVDDISPAAEDPAAPSFPKDALALALAAIALVAVASVLVNWFVGEKVQTISGSQIAVQIATQEVTFVAEQKERVLELALATEEPSYLEESVLLQQRLQSRLAELEEAIFLPQNRAAFREAYSSERALRFFEDRQTLLAAQGRFAEARRLGDSDKVEGLRADFLAKISEIHERSRMFVGSGRRDAAFWLNLNLFGNMVAILMIGATLIMLVRRTRKWARQLQVMEHTSRQAAQAKADFLATMSHEIRTPLNGVIGFADLLLDDRTLKPDQRRQINLIQSAGTMLLTVVNDVLDFSRLEAERFDLDESPFALQALLDECISIIRPMTDEKGLGISFEADPALSDWYLGDADRLRQVVLNLLNNAAKFTHRGTVAMQVTNEASHDGRDDLAIIVRDTGIGIPADRVTRLFQPFTQADSSTAKHFGGSGLGLSICRRLVELMGGTISLESVEGEGSVFTVQLSLPRAEKPSDAAASGDHENRPARILLVEDLPMNREIACAMLARGGHDVQCASSGETALVLAAGQDFDLVLMDIQMPGMDGVEATGRIRALPGPRGRVPILAMTANILPQQLRSYREAGMDGHVAKPLRQALLDEAIASAACSGDGDTGSSHLKPDETIFDRDTFDSIVAIMPADKILGHVDKLDGMVADALAERDSSLLEAAAHKIVSQAGALGLFRLAVAARSVEEAIREGGDIEAAREALAVAEDDAAKLARPLLITGKAA